MSSLLHESAVRRFIMARRTPDTRISKEYLRQLEAYVRVLIERSLQLPYNRHHKTIKDFGGLL